MNCQNFPKKDQEFQKSRFSFYKQKILNIPQDLRHMISLKAQAIGEAKQKHIIQFFLLTIALLELLFKGWVLFDKLIIATTILSVQSLIPCVGKFH